MANLVFTELVPVNRLQELLEAQFKLIGMPTAILDLDERVLVAVGWQEICTHYHRRHPEAVACCKESDAYIKAHLEDCREGYVDYRCKNGLWDVAMPIIIEGQHLATFFVGQFFYRDDLPDRQFFLAQAARYGFDESGYMAAMERVPIYSREYVRDILIYCRSLVEKIAETGLKNLRLDREVQERRKSEREASFLRHLGESTRDCIHVLDPADDYRIFYANPAACAHFGWDRETLLQMRITDWDRDFDLNRLSDMLEKMRQGTLVRFETIHRVASGALIPVEVTASYLEFEGRPLISGSFRDISDRKAMEAELREREQNLVEAQRMARVGNWAWYLSGRLKSASAECWTILRTSAETFAGNQEALLNLICKEDRDGLRIAVAGLLHDGRPCTVKYRLRTAAGEEVVINDQRELVLDQAGKPLGMVGTIQDVTEQARLAEELREKDMLLLQQSRMAAMGEMISYIAHQWRQPLNLLSLLVGNLADAEAGQGPEEKQQAVDQVDGLIQLMSSTIDDFRNFFRTDQFQMPFDLKQAVQKILDLVAADLNSHRIETLFEAEEGLYVVGYGNEFAHVLLNILNNAKEALVASDIAAPHIHIRLFQEGKKKVVTVGDNAGGVDDALLERLFEPHFTTKKTGTGIGLYISKVIIEKRLRGAISACNAREGIEFRIEF